MKRFWTQGVALALFLAITVYRGVGPGRRWRRATRRRVGTVAMGPLPTIEQRTSGMKKMDGFFPMYLDTKSDRLYLEIAKFDAQFLYVRHIAYGAGTAGLNRGAVSQPFVVHFSRTGPKVMLTAENTEWRTSSDEPAQQAAVKQAFPESVMAAFTIAAEDADDHVLVDATDFFTRDAQDFAGASGNRISAGPGAQHDCAGKHEELPAELRDRDPADLHR